MVEPEDISPELIKQAQRDTGVRIVTVKRDITQLIAMLTSGNPPDLVRGVGAVDAPYFVARDVAEELIPFRRFFAGLPREPEEAAIVDG